MKPLTDSHPATAPAAPSNNSPAPDSQSINLADPYLAAFLAWLIPGAGHFYQRRWGKGGLFMVCVLGTFFFGLWMGQGRVVYASWRSVPGREGAMVSDQRYPYICQICVGLPAMPALVQSLRMGTNPPKAQLWGGFMAPPLLYGQSVPGDWAANRVAAGEFEPSDFPDLNLEHPAPEVIYIHSTDRAFSDSPKASVGNAHDPYNQLSDWNLKMGPFFELGTVYTLIAGLLNILAIYDAWGGPVGAVAQTVPPSPAPSATDRKPEGA